MGNYNWREFVKRITIHTEPSAIYNAWTTQEGLEGWFLSLAEFKSPQGVIRKRKEEFKQGDRYRWLWFGYDDTFAEENEIISVNGKDKVDFVFSGGCVVAVTVKQEDGETICELRQTMPMEDESLQQHFFIECGKGWDFYMTNLKSILEGGVDLRNKNKKIQNVINA
jgi:uncharacterized protein YndB with AHSA1/START domain